MLFYVRGALQYHRVLAIICFFISLSAVPVAPALALSKTAAQPAPITPALLVDVNTGQVLYQQAAKAPWYPASLTKLMTIYVALNAVRAGRVSLDTPFVVSRRATTQAPSKMGFEPGTEVTLDNALKMLIVKSANDIAIMVAEGLSGSVDDFAHEMNAAARRLGMSQTFYVNPNGLPDVRQVTSATDMALVARALLLEFPQMRPLFQIGALQFGEQIIQTHNGMLGRYPGADGMKTGFTCAAGFNIVTTATRNGRTLMAVVLGASSVKRRNIRAAELLEYGFGGLMQANGQASQTLNQLASAAPTNQYPVDMHPYACGRRSANAIAYDAQEDSPVLAEARHRFEAALGENAHDSLETELSHGGRPQFDPVPIFVGRLPGWSGPVLHSRDEVPVANLTAPDNAAPANTQASPVLPALPAAPFPGKVKSLQVHGNGQGHGQGSAKSAANALPTQKPSLVAKPISKPLAGALGLPLTTQFAPVTDPAVPPAKPSLLDNQGDD